MSNSPYPLRKADLQHKVYSNGQSIPQTDCAEYLQMHLDPCLTWKHHIRQEAAQIRLKTRQLYWLIEHEFYLGLSVHQAIVQPI